MTLGAFTTFLVFCVFLSKALDQSNIVLFTAVLAIGHKSSPSRAKIGKMGTRSGVWKMAPGHAQELGIMMSSKVMSGEFFQPHWRSSEVSTPAYGECLSPLWWSVKSRSVTACTASWLKVTLHLSLNPTHLVMGNTIDNHTETTMAPGHFRAGLTLAPSVASFLLGNLRPSLQVHLLGKPISQILRPH